MHWTWPHSSLPTLLTRCVPSPGYEDMEAQFAWDDKTIRQTFIRKVRCCFRQNKRKNSSGTRAINEHWRLLAGVRHPHGPAARHCRHRRPLLILVSPVLYFIWFYFLHCDTWQESSGLFPPQCSSQVFHPDSSRLVHGFLVSEKSLFHLGSHHHRFLRCSAQIIHLPFVLQPHVLCNLHCVVLLWRAEVIILPDPEYNTTRYPGKTFVNVNQNKAIINVLQDMYSHVWCTIIYT